jgi:phospholipase C
MDAEHPLDPNDATWRLTDDSEMATPILQRPNLSLITPLGKDSQHNNQSMAAGDNWIGSMVQAVMSGPDWPSTTIFITYDDAGGLYDHAPPPPGRGIRVPMVIVSPYTRPGFTDSASATLASMLAYVEHTFGLGSLSLEDANAYDFANSFDYSQVPLGALSMVRRKIPAWEQRWIKAHPVDPDDPT